MRPLAAVRDGQLPRQVIGGDWQMAVMASAPAFPQQPEPFTSRLNGQNLWARRSESDPFAARKLIHLEA